MEITFLAAAGPVTGSKHLAAAGGPRVPLESAGFGEGPERAGRAVLP